MWRYILKRTLYLVPVLLGASIVVFAMMHLAPGDPARAILGPMATPEEVARVQRLLGLNEPVHIQYLNWLSRASTGDLGESIYLKQPVTDLVLQRLPPTLLLMFSSFVVAVVSGVLAGVAAAVYRNGWIDRLIMSSVTVGVSMPLFYLGMVMIVIFAVKLRWFPTGGFVAVTAVDATPGAVLWHLILPALTLAAGPLAVVARMMRSAMLEQLGRAYVRTARAKGLPERLVMLGHALRNALIPTVDLIGLQMGFLLSQTALVEIVFSYPGLGDLLVESIMNRDMPLTQGIVLVMTIGYALINLLTDAVHARLDPALRLD